jgi:hypothetical protein
VRRDRDRTPFRWLSAGRPSSSAVTVERPGGARYLTEFFECCGCSVMFRDDEKIARCERFRPGKGMTPDFKTRG